MSMTKNLFTLFVSYFIFLGSGFSTEKPNILIFFVDDMGWRDTQVNGSVYYESPAQLRLATEGLSFSQAYAQPLCSPSRAALLSGMYPGARLNLSRAITGGSVDSPKVPEELMRSRYSAFAKHLADYLITTSHSNLNKVQTKSGILQWAQENNWQKLEVLFASENQVEFKAHYNDTRGKSQVHHELSDFVFENGKWLYESGVIDPPARTQQNISRNAPCPCGSGKKYKKCCGR